jgi:hypothetical protein
MNKLIKEFAIELAKYLDWDFPNDPTEYTFTSDGLSKFAALIAAHEREACAQICEAEAKKFYVTDDVCAYLIRARSEHES